MKSNIDGDGQNEVEFVTISTIEEAQQDNNIIAEFYRLGKLDQCSDWDPNSGRNYEDPQNLLQKDKNDHSKSFGEAGKSSLRSNDTLANSSTSRTSSKSSLFSSRSDLSRSV